jgi:hypothetical protein
LLNSPPDIKTGGADVINLLPEPKILLETGGFTKKFNQLCLAADPCGSPEILLETARLRFWNSKAVEITLFNEGNNGIELHIDPSLEGIQADNYELFLAQGYCLEISSNQIVLQYQSNAGFINGLTSIKQLLIKEDGGFCLPLCKVTDYPSLSVRAVAPTFSWYAGYGRIGFDSQLWSLDEWAEFINICLDNKINQLNMVMYGYWPFDLPDYPETTFQNVPIKIWNAENRRWLTVRFSHPNLEEPFLSRLIAYAHRMEVKIFAYVGLNSYNGGYSIKHPEARGRAPKTEKFLNDFDSLCLSYPGTVDYILDSMRAIASLGFDGFTLEESEEGFWFCECDACRERWHKNSSLPVEAKHKANLWLLNQIYHAIREINPQAVIGIRAFRQPPLEKDPAFLKECARSMPADIMLFWAPGLYVPEAEFEKWCTAFGKERIWGRDSEANSITSTMGRLYRTFKSNMIRYEDEANEQVIETDIRQHKGSAKMGVHGINGFMFEWYGLFMHLFAHGNYGWGSVMEESEFYNRACALNFGNLGEKVLYVLKNMVTIHESQIPLYSTAFPFQKNKMTEADIRAINAAKVNHPKLLSMIEELREEAEKDEGLRCWLPHFNKLHNAERRNAVIYDLVLASLRYEAEADPSPKDALLNEILSLNEADFDIAKEMFFDINPVGETGVKSCMFPYHEIKRLIYNIRNPHNPDNNIICSGIEALGWIWL